MPKNNLRVINLHRILCGDARKEEDWEKLFGNIKANLIFTSAPYADKRRKFYGGVRPDDYIEWFAPVALNIKNHLAEDGSFLLNIKEGVYQGRRHLFVHKLLIYLVEKIGFEFIDELIWKKPPIPGRFPNRFKDGFERIFHLAKSVRPKFHPERVRIISRRAFRYGDVTRARKAGQGTLIEGKFSQGLALPSNVLAFNTNGEKLSHPAVFPVALAEFFIEAFSDKGDIICDPFLGSGTTLIAAQKLDRRCFGMEIKKEHVDLAVKRLKGEGAKKAVN